jgi:hypothetical protein
MTVKVPEIPSRIAKLPKDHRGFPVPWFVTWIDGQPDFRIVTPSRIVDATRNKRCWICGEQLGRFMAFVIGPMCAINRVSGEPPSHRECAEFAARACPFLTQPRMKRNGKDLPCGHSDGPGIAIKRNPGVALVWVTKRYRPFQVDGGLLFNVGVPVETLWFTEGRPATRDEVLASIESGIHLLREEAEKEGPAAIHALEQMHQAALTLLPAASAA